MSNVHIRLRIVVGKSVISRSSRALAMGLSAAIALLALVMPAPADAVTTHAWSDSTVCVESQVGAEWGVRSALRTWNELDGGPRFVLRDTCTDYDDTVTVSYLNANDRYTGWTKWYWDDAGHLVHADVTVNPLRIRAFASQDRSCQRRHTMTHEFGHALGLRHYLHSHAGSVMSYLGWERNCGDLSAHDRADYAHLYPTTPATQAPGV